MDSCDFLCDDMSFYLRYQKKCLAIKNKEL